MRGGRGFDVGKGEDFLCDYAGVKVRHERRVSNMEPSPRTFFNDQLELEARPRLGRDTEENSHRRKHDREELYSPVGSLAML